MTNLINVTLPAVINVPVKKCGKSFEFLADKLPQHTVDFIFTHGLKQLLNDTHAGESDKELAWGNVIKKAGQLYTGEVNARGIGSGVSGDYARFAWQWCNQTSKQPVGVLKKFAKENGMTVQDIMQRICQKTEANFTDIDAMIQDKIAEMALQVDDVVTMTMEDLL